MRLCIYELKPGFSGILIGPNLVSGADRSASRGSSYSIVIGAKEKNPSNRTKEKIKSEIARVWEELFEPAKYEEEYKRKLYAPPYGVSIVPDTTPPAGERENPQIVYNGFYLVFALLESEGGNSDIADPGTVQEIRKMVENQFSGHKIKPRIGVIVLYNCSVQILEGDGPELPGDLESKPLYSSPAEWVEANTKVVRRRK